jgi:hypothetical protein
MRLIYVIRRRHLGRLDGQAIEFGESTPDPEGTESPGHALSEGRVPRLLVEATSTSAPIKGLEVIVSQAFLAVLRRNQGAIGRVQDWPERGLLPQPIHPG